MYYVADRYIVYIACRFVVAAVYNVIRLAPPCPDTVFDDGQLISRPWYGGGNSSSRNTNRPVFIFYFFPNGHVKTIFRLTFIRCRRRRRLHSTLQTTLPHPTYIYSDRSDFVYTYLCYIIIFITYDVYCTSWPTTLHSIAVSSSCSQHAIPPPLSGNARIVCL